MKSRTGFVSNSSSTAFIFDKRLPSISKWVQEQSRFVPKPQGLGRGTSAAVGQGAVDYANYLLEDAKGWGDWGSPLADWILEWSGKLGADNVVFVRESDEGMGGELDESFPYHKALAEMEYH